MFKLLELIFIKSKSLPYLFDLVNESTYIPSKIFVFPLPLSPIKILIFGDKSIDISSA